MGKRSRRLCVRWVASCLAVAILMPAGCSSQPASTPTLTLATTTSTQDSGLLDVLVPLFKEQSGVDVKVVAVGSGQALQLGRRGDADVLLVHDPEGEQQLVGWLRVDRETTRPVRDHASHLARAGDGLHDRRSPRGSFSKADRG